MTLRTALVTGGSRGIGQAIAIALSQRGVAVLAPTREELDLAVPGSVAAWCHNQAHRPIDILINNAGINTLRGVASLDDAAWAGMEQINLRAPLQLMRELLPRMAERHWGRVVNLTSIWGHVARENRAGYAATKAAMSALTRNAALEFASAGVLVNAVSPGFVATELTRSNNSPDALAVICGKIPLGRLAEPKEIAELVAWLASDANSYVTGQTLVADGGYTVI